MLKPNMDKAHKQCQFFYTVIPFVVFSIMQSFQTCHAELD